MGVLCPFFNNKKIKKGEQGIVPWKKKIMRKPIMAGNWKMNKTRDEALQFIYAVAENLPSIDKLDSIVCAPAIVLRDLVKRQGENLRIGAQNMNENDKNC